MKTFLIAIFCLLTLAAAGFFLKSAMERPSENHRPASHETASPREGDHDAGKTTLLTARHDVPATGGDHRPGGGESPQPVAQQSPLRQGPPPAVRTGQNALSSVAPIPSAQREEPVQTAGNSGGRATYSGTSTTSSSIIGPQSSGPSTAPASQGGVLEVDPGVPLPAAFVPQENVPQTSQSAAAQQQIADSFTQQMDTALSQSPQTPGSDAAVNESYYQALDQANEQFRSLYGNDSYNSSTMKASLDAMQ